MGRWMWRAISPAAKSLDEDDTVRVVILRGVGEEAFVAGADISEFEQLRTGEAGSRYEVENAKAYARSSRSDGPSSAVAESPGPRRASGVTRRIFA